MQTLVLKLSHFLIRPGVKALEREVRELKRANEILKLASDVNDELKRSAVEMI
jgi:hypothetical protein